MASSRTSDAAFGGLGKFRASHTRTFSNDGAGGLSIFTVTGDVHLNIVVLCTTNVASAAAANIELGTSGDTNAIIPSTLATDLDAREIWHDNTPDSEIEASSVAVRGYTISDGNDVILTLGAQVDSGVLEFRAFWTPISDNGDVVGA